MNLVRRLIAGAAVAVISSGSSFIGVTASAQGVDAALLARMDKEKTDRQACKVDICKSFAAPTSGGPVVCDVTKTWLKDEILQKVVGGSCVWGYGHMKCSVKLNLDRTAMGKVLTAASDKFSMPEHKLTCSVEDKDPAKGEAFKIDVSITPKATFENGQAKAVDLEPVKTEGSAVASAAVASLMAVDKVSGAVSRAISSEINSFLFDKCKADGVEIVARKP